MIRILLVDDHAMFREGIRKILEETKDIRLTGEAGSAKEALELVRKNNFDVVLLDIHLPDRDGLDVLKQILAIKPNLKVLVLTIYEEDKFAIRTFESGASGYITKNRAGKELIDAIYKVYKGGRYVSHAFSEKYFDEYPEKKTRKKAHKKLTDREIQVLVALAQGKSPKEIAHNFHLSVNTVNTYKHRIYNKLGIRNIAELTYYAIKEGLIL